MRDINGILFDLDGVLYVGEEVIAGAGDALDYCRSLGLPFRFITNTSTRTSADVARKLIRMGIEVREEEIFSAVSATRDFLLSRGRPSVHLLIRDAVKAEFHQFRQNEERPDYVIVGDIGAAWDYELMNRVFRELLDGADLIAMHMNRFWEGESGLQMDIGAFVAGLEFVSGKQAKVIGKPSAEFFNLAVSALGLPEEQVLVIGDDIENDIGGAQAAGLRGALVRTGKYRKAFTEQSEIVPDVIIDSIADLPALLSSRSASR